MRYLINRKTNEHERYDGQNYDATKYRIVEADSEGWIPHTGTVCPLPEDVSCSVREASGWQSTAEDMAAGSWLWEDIVSYRPILAEKVQEPVTDAARKEMPDLVVTRDGIECADQKAALLEFKMQCLEASERGKRLAEKEAERRNKATQYDPRSVSFNLLDRLKAAHEHAAQIPDLEAELREVLGSMGYDLVSRSPFVEPEDYAAAIAEREPAVETPQDMTDWRNWREGDLVECVDNYGWGTVFLTGHIYKVEKLKTDGPIIAGQEIGRHVSDFRFHSRPAKGGEVMGQLKPCPFCGGVNTDQSFMRGYRRGDKTQSIIAAGCSDCGAVGPAVLVPDNSTGYSVALERWNERPVQENKMQEQKPFSPSDLFKDGSTGCWGFTAHGHSIVIHYKDAEPVKVTLNGVDFVREAK